MLGHGGGDPASGVTAWHRGLRDLKQPSGEIHRRPHLRLRGELAVPGLVVVDESNREGADLHRFQLRADNVPKGRADTQVLQLDSTWQDDLRATVLGTH